MSLAEIRVGDTSVQYQVTLLVKITAAIVGGAAAAVHQVGRSRLALAAGGAVGFLAAVGAVFCGYLLTTGT
ncbi:MAG: hypothetical protein ACFCVK_17025 [Acidimicrobiales bacterium]